jgi:hypothetical protein
MCPTKERKIDVRAERTKRAVLMEETFWGLRPQTPGTLRFIANPS